MPVTVATTAPTATTPGYNLVALVVAGAAAAWLWTLPGVRAALAGLLEG